MPADDDAVLLSRHKCSNREQITSPFWVAACRRLEIATTPSPSPGLTHGTSRDVQVPQHAGPLLQTCFSVSVSLRHGA